MPSVLDHILIFALTIVFPLYGLLTWKKFKRSVRSGSPNAKKKAYVETIVLEWAFAIGVLIWWTLQGRNLGELGLNIEVNLRFLIAQFLVIVGCAYLIWQWHFVRKLEGKIPESLRAQIETVAEMIPFTSGERNLFIAVALTAGICEELLYRGYLLWYMKSYVSWIPAILICIIVFGLGHTYQGRSGILKTGLTGGLMMAIYVFSGSLIGPMILHSVNDITGGLIGREVIRNPVSAQT